MSFFTGQILQQRYRIVELAGEGAMSEVYLAVQVDDRDARVAIKVLKQNLMHQRAIADRFRLEFETLARLEHPGILKVLDYFQQGAALCMVLEFMEGQSLADRLDRGDMAPQEALPIFGAFLDALEYAHLHGVIHRDIKPSNILIGHDGRPRLCDFGIARQLGGSSLTLTGMTLGTVQYMSPEQIRTPQAVDHRSDLYSAGVLLFEMLTGRVPFGWNDATTDFEIMQQHVQSDPPEPHRFNPRLDEALCHVLKKSLRKDPDRRYQSALDFSRALDRTQRSDTLRTDDIVKPESRPPTRDPGPTAPSALGPPSGRSRRYAVYRHPSRGAAAVRVGFSGVAVCFGPFWLVAGRLYGHAIGWLLAAASIYAMLWGALVPPRDGSTEFLLWLVSLAGVVLWLLPAACGHRWLEDELDRRGYRFVDERASGSTQEAVRDADYEANIAIAR